MAYTFSKIDAASLTIEDLRPLIEASFHQVEKNMKFPVEADTRQLKMTFLEQMLQLILRAPSAFVMKMMDDDLAIFYNIGNVVDGTFYSRFTFLGPNKVGSTLWAWRDDISQSRYDFLTSHNISRVSAHIPVGSNIPSAIALLSCYRLESSDMHSVAPSSQNWTFETFNSELITYTLVDPSAA
jgi:hypothetical protein